MLIEEVWVEATANGQTQGHWVTKTLRSYAIPSSGGDPEDLPAFIPDVREDSNIEIPDIREEDLEVPDFGDEEEYLLRNLG